MADGSAEITPQAGDDIRSALASAIASNEAKAEPDKPEKDEKPAKVAKEPEVAAQPGGEAAGDKPEADGGDKPAAENAGDAKPAEAEGDEKPGAEQKPTVEAPANWAQADKDRFNKLAKDSPENAQWLLQRHKDMEADYTRKTQKLADLDREYAPVQKLLDPHREIMRQKGFTPESLITAWYNVEKALMSGSDAAINIVDGIVNGYKIDKAKLAAKLGFGSQTATTPQGEKPDQQPAGEPVVRDPRVDQVVNWIQTEQQQRFNSEAQRVMKHIEDFSKATDQSGKPLHPYFDEVEADMVALSHATGVTNLDQLYERAVWANTSTRQKLQADQAAAQEAQRKADEEKKRAEDRAKAEAARKAAKSVTGAPGPGQPAARRVQADRSIRDELLEAAEEVGV